MAEKKTRAPRPKNAKDVRTLTLWNGKDRFECKVFGRVTGHIYSQFPDIIREYEAVVSPDISEPASVVKYNSITDQEEKNAFHAEHQVEILRWQTELLNRAAQLKNTSPLQTPDAIAARRVYLTKSIKLILDTEHIEDDQKELIESDIDSEFWMDQDIGGEVADFVERFRKRLG